MLFGVGCTVILSVAMIAGRATAKKIEDQYTELAIVDSALLSDPFGRLN
jgi:hypothetical protein